MVEIATFVSLIRLRKLPSTLHLFKINNQGILDVLKYFFIHLLKEDIFSPLFYQWGNYINLLNFNFEIIRVIGSCIEVYKETSYAFHSNLLMLHLI